MTTFFFEGTLSLAWLKTRNKIFFLYLRKFSLTEYIQLKKYQDKVRETFFLKDLHVFVFLKEPVVNIFSSCNIKIQKQLKMSQKTVNVQNKSNNKLENTSVFCTFYLCNKILIRKPLVDISHILLFCFPCYISYK